MRIGALKFSAVRAGLVALVCGVVALAGCSGGSINGVSQAGANAMAGASLAGRVYGGRQPIIGAQVYLFAANTTGYGGAGIAASSSNASLSLLTSGAGRTLDTSGGATDGDYYVTTDNSGNFTISGDYSCTANSQVYLYALGGNPGAGANAAAGLMAVLGNCPVTGNFATATPFVVVNEVSTVAAAYAFAGFATDATHVSSSGTALAQVGIANAFANAGNLVTLGTGVALATTPAGNGTVPQSEINTLGNVLAACVNSTGAVTGPTNATACYTLLTNALAGGTTGAQPADTATAAINIAHNPVTNVAGLYGLAGGTVPFAPGLIAAPNDWTAQITFTANGLGAGFNVAIDGRGDAWVTSPSTNSVIELLSLGVGVSGSPFTGSGLTSPTLLSIDPSGNTWVTGISMHSVVELTGSGGSSSYSGLNTFGGQALTGPSGIAIDGAGNIWIPNSAGNIGVSEFTNAGAFTGWINGANFNMSVPDLAAVDSSGYVWIPDSHNNGISQFSTAASLGSGGTLFPGGGLNSPSTVAIDSLGNVWVTNSASLTKLSNSGVAISSSGGIIGGGLGDPLCVAIDGGGNVWVGDGSSKSLIEFSNVGSVLSGSGGFRSGDQNYIASIGIDGSGDVWTTTIGNGYVSEIIGLARPVVTPLSVGVKNSMLGTRP